MDYMGMTDEQAKEYITMLFEGYNKRKRENRLYTENDDVPKIIIESYYDCIDSPEFDTLVTNFRRKYILNENKMEQVHEVLEREGLKVVYEYIQNFNNTKNLNIFTILTIHQLLYSKVPFPEFGGKYRVQNIFLPGTGTETTNYDLIPKAIQELYFPVQDLIKEGVEIGTQKQPEKIISYIDKCIELKCKLIKIHPFFDGNGRTIRAFINLLFKIANIPLVYIKVSERSEYHKAMNLANNENNFDYIKTFYYYKICDSIIELDINYKDELIQKDEEPEKTSKNK